MGAPGGENEEGHPRYRVALWYYSCQNHIFNRLRGSNLLGLGLKKGSLKQPEVFIAGKSEVMSVRFVGVVFGGHEVGIYLFAEFICRPDHCA